MTAPDAVATVPTREECCECGAWTGKAGPGDGSLYSTDGERGPYCERCHSAYVELPDTAAERDAAIAAAADLRVVLASVTAERDAAQYAARDWRGVVDAERAENANLRTHATDSLIDLEAAQIRIAVLEAELADVRHSEARYKTDRDEARDMARLNAERSVKALKRAKAAEAEAAAGRDLDEGLCMTAHRYRGLCPGRGMPGSRDPECPACACHVAYDAALATDTDATGGAA